MVMTLTYVFGPKAQFVELEKKDVLVYTLQQLFIVTKL